MGWRKLQVHSFRAQLQALRIREEKTQEDYRTRTKTGGKSTICVLYDSIEGNVGAQEKEGRRAIYARKDNTTGTLGAGTGL